MILLMVFRQCGTQGGLRRTLGIRELLTHTRDTCVNPCRAKYGFTPNIVTKGTVQSAIPVSVRTGVSAAKLVD